MHAAFAPLVHSYFRKAVAGGSRVFLSEAQLIVADPLAEVQTWHLDATGGPGLSIFVPLTHVARDRGPQELLPGTHHLHATGLGLRQRLRRCLAALTATHGAVPLATDCSTWFAGDALVLDSRLLHRGLGNDSLGAPMQVVVLRYDLAESPPPGCGRRWLRTMTTIGGVLDAVFKLYAIL